MSRIIIIVVVFLVASAVIQGLDQFFKKSFKTNKVVAPSIASYPWVILPGFGNDAIDYCNPLNNGYEGSLKASLESRGIENVEIVNIKRTAWLNIARAIFSLEFWRNECKPENLFEFYFREVDQTVKALQEKHSKPVILVGHSAGGWLARAILADGKWLGQKDGDESSDLVLGVVTLGAPHFPPVASAMCMTRGALKYVDTEFPGSYLKQQQGLFYITVGGSAVEGDVTAPEGSIQVFASNSYRQVTGRMDGVEEAGDGVVPLSTAHLDGATQITIPEAWHSIQAPSNNWYGGSDKIVDKWFPTVMKAVEKSVASKK